MMLKLLKRYSQTKKFKSVYLVSVAKARFLSFKHTFISESHVLATLDSLNFQFEKYLTT